MGHYVAIKQTPTEMKHFKVPLEVYLYIRQLELALKFSGKTKKALKKLYPGRFSRFGGKEES